MCWLAFVWLKTLRFRSAPFHTSQCSLSHVTLDNLYIPTKLWCISLRCELRTKSRLSTSRRVKSESSSMAPRLEWSSDRFKCRKDESMECKLRNRVTYKTNSNRVDLTVSNKYICIQDDPSSRCAVVYLRHATTDEKESHTRETWDELRTGLHKSHAVHKQGPRHIRFWEWEVAGVRLEKWISSGKDEVVFKSLTQTTSFNGKAEVFRN